MKTLARPLSFALVLCSSAPASAGDFSLGLLAGIHANSIEGSVAKGLLALEGEYRLTPGWGLGLGYEHGAEDNSKAWMSSASVRGVYRADRWLEGLYFGGLVALVHRESLVWEGNVYVDTFCCSVGAVAGYDYGLTESLRLSFEPQLRFHSKIWYPSVRAGARYAF
jgi:hypothetical protein